jgi:hypothetical protein
MWRDTEITCIIIACLFPFCKALAGFLFWKCILFGRREF